MEIIADVKRVGRKGIHLRNLVRKERRTTVADIPLPERLRWWSRGFLSQSVVYYGLTEDNWRDYVSDYVRALRTPLINGSYNPTLNDKLVFYLTMTHLSAPTPAVYGLVGRDGTSWLGSPAGEEPVTGLMQALERRGELVLKPFDGGLGERIVFLELEDGRIRANGAPVDAGDLPSLLRPGTLICERVHQGRYAAEIFAGSTNTLRIVTMWDYEAGAPFVAAAAHRFGTHRSAPVDNTGQGGVGAAVDAATGELGPLLSAEGARLRRDAHHPDTGVRVQGTLVPSWATLVEDLLALARRLAHVPYIGWDVVVGDDGHSLIEGNAAPDTLTQAFSGPWLADPRIRRFYEHHGTVSRSSRRL